MSNASDTMFLLRRAEAGDADALGWLLERDRQRLLRIEQNQGISGQRVGFDRSQIRAATRQFLQSQAQGLAAVQAPNPHPRPSRNRTPDHSDTNDPR